MKIDDPRWKEKIRPGYVEGYWYDFLKRAEKKEKYKYFERDGWRGKRKDKKAHVNTEDQDKERL